MRRMDTMPFYLTKEFGFKMSQLRLKKDARKMYGELAWTWPIISPPEDYVEESKFYKKTILKYSKIPVKNLLHLGCGGGHIDMTLKKYFNLTSVDISSSMLKLAKKLNPEVKYVKGDMRSFSINKMYDAVLCADSIDYMNNRKDLKSAFKTAYDHLKSGGVFLILPDVEIWKENFKQNKTSVDIRKKGNIEIVLVENFYDPKKSDNSYEATFIYLIRKKGELEVQIDRHIEGNFSLSTWTDLLKEVGFEAKRIKYSSYPTFVCIKCSG